MKRIIYEIKRLILALVILNEDDEDVSKCSKRLFGIDIIEEWNKRRQHDNR